MKIDPVYLLDLLKRMIRIDSVLPHEERLAFFLAQEIRSLGWEAELQEVTPGRPNVTAMMHFGPSSGFLVFSGHSDTVPPASDWETDPFEPIEEGGRIYGLGAANMKAGLACSLAALKALVEAKELYTRLGRIGIAVTVDQEGLSIGAEALLKTAYGKCDAMIHGEHFYGDSIKDYLPLAGTGKVLYRIALRGRAAHAFRPEEGGINAIRDASKLVTALDGIRLGEHPLLGRGTLCVLKMEGGYKEYSLVVPESCEMVVTRLLGPGETRGSAVQDLLRLIESLGLESEIKVKTPAPFYEPYRLDEDAPVFRSFKEAYREVVGVDPCFAGHRGVTDANVFAARGGIPTLVFGPKGSNHHRAGEYVELSTLETTARVYAETVVRFFVGRA